MHTFKIFMKINKYSQLLMIRKVVVTKIQKYLERDLKLYLWKKNNVKDYFVVNCEYYFVCLNKN